MADPATQDADEWIAPPAGGDAHDDVWLSPEGVASPDTSHTPEEAHKFGLMDTWPVRLAKGIYHGIENAATLPHDVMVGDVNPMSPEGIGRSAQMAMVINPAEAMSGAGLARAAAQGLPEDAARTFANRNVPAAPPVPVAPPVPAMAAPKTPVDLYHQALSGGEQAEPSVPVTQPPIPANMVNPSRAELAAASQRTNVPLSTVAASNFPGFEQAAGGLRDIPFSGTPIIKSSRNTIDTLGQRVQDAASGVGSASAPDVSGSIAKDALVDWVKGDSANVLNRLYDRVDEFMPNGALGELAETKDAVAKILSDRKEAGLKGPGSAVSTISQAIMRDTQEGGLTYAGIKKLRTTISDMMSGKITPEAGTSQPDLKQIYGSLTRDLQSVVEQNGGPDALKAWQKANTVAQQVSQRRGEIAKIVGATGDASAESVLGQIEKMAALKGGNMQRLSIARKAMGPDAWNEASSSLIHQMGRDPQGNFSPARFITRYGNMSPAGRAIVFGSTEKGAQYVQALNDVATLSTRANRLEKLANVSGSGRTVSVAGMASGAVLHPLAVIGSVLGGRAVAYMLARPISAQALARWAQAYQMARVTPTQATKAAYGIASNTLADAAEGAGIAKDKLIAALPALIATEQPQTPRLAPPNAFASGGAVKVSKEAADYGPGKKGERCLLCKHYRDHKCMIVSGKIDPRDWCKFFRRRGK